MAKKVTGKLARADMYCVNCFNKNGALIHQVEDASRRNQTREADFFLFLNHEGSYWPPHIAAYLA